MDNLNQSNGGEEYPEIADKKMVGYYQFVQKKETYFTRNTNKLCENKRTAEVDFRNTISDVIKLFLKQRESYMRHRQHLINDHDVWPLYKKLS